MKVLYFFFCAVFFTLGCQSNEEFAPKTPLPSEIPNQEGWEATLVKTKNGKLMHRIEYGYMRGFAEKQLLHFSDGVEVEFFDENEELQSTVYSNRAVFNERTNNITLEGNVSVYSEDSVRLFTQKLKWNENTAKITTDESVMFINAQNDTIYGEGFESERSLENWVIKKPTGSSSKKLKLELIEPRDD